MKVLIVCNGDISNNSFLDDQITKHDYIIAADGGANHLERIGLLPDVLIGDLDSINNDILNKYKKCGVELKKFPTNKDFTDTHLAIDYALEKRADSITIAGALGSRYDHSYANLMLLYRLLKLNVPASIADKNTILRMSDSCININGYKGKLLSILPFAGDVMVEYTKGLQYPIENKKLAMKYPLGVSNVILEDETEIKIKHGTLLFVISFE